MPLNQQAEIMLKIVADGLRPTLDSLKERLTAVEVENRILRDRLNRQHPLRAARLGKTSRP